MDVMPDVVKPGGELFVRQMQYGQRYCREQVGREVTVAWLLDTFGHHPQMPQLQGRLGAIEQRIVRKERNGAPWAGAF
jgi:alpha-mannosidase